jgi:hypothetical protein
MTTEEEERFSPLSVMATRQLHRSRGGETTAPHAHELLPLGASATASSSSEMLARQDEVPWQLVDCGVVAPSLTVMPKQGRHRHRRLRLQVLSTGVLFAAALLLLIAVVSFRSTPPSGGGGCQRAAGDGNSVGRCQKIDLPHGAVRKTPLFSHFIIQTISLARQARDKHREMLRGKGASCRSTRGRLRWHTWSHLHLRFVRQWLPPSSCSSCTGSVWS